MNTLQLFIHPTSAGHLGSFQLGVFMNAAKNTLTLVFGGNMYQFPKSRSAGSKVFTLNF